jgi:hypothetical protein
LVIVLLAGCGDLPNTSRPVWSITPPSPDPVLDRPLGDVYWNFRQMWDFASRLRKKDVRVCLEMAVVNDAQANREELHIRDATPRKLLDAMVAVRPEYTWRLVAGTDIVLITPRKSKLDYLPPTQIVGPIEFNDVVWKCGLRDRGIKSSYELAMGRKLPPPPDRTIMPKLTGNEPVSEVIARLCYAYDSTLWYGLYPSGDGFAYLFLEGPQPKPSGR